MTKQYPIQEIKNAQALIEGYKTELNTLYGRQVFQMEPLRDQVEAVLTERMSEELKTFPKVIKLSLGNEFQPYVLEFGLKDVEGDNRLFGHREEIRYENPRYFRSENDGKYRFVMSYGSLGSFSSTDRTRVIWLEFLSIVASQLGVLEELFEEFTAKHSEVKDRVKTIERLKEEQGWTINDLKSGYVSEQFDKMVNSVPIVAKDSMYMRERAGGHRYVGTIKKLTKMPSGDYKVEAGSTHFYMRANDLKSALLGQKLIDEIKEEDLQ